MDIPAHLKLQILSHLPPQLVFDVLAPSPSLQSSFDLMLGLKERDCLKFFSEDLLCELQEKGFIIRDNFLGSEKLQGIRQEASTLYEKGQLKVAGMNKGQDKWVHSATRGDSILWMDREDEDFTKQYASLSNLMNELDSIRKELNQSCGFKSLAIQTQLARYPPGTRYVRHRDAILPKEDKEKNKEDNTANNNYNNEEGGNKLTRRLTVLYYLNEGWQHEHGGQLRMHLSDGKYVDVEPIGDRVVIFWSALMEHEVLESHHERYAVTMWFY